MANKRMFNIKIIDTDNFLEMPSSARLLYYDLSMRADDDGFVSNPKKILRITGCAEDDLRVLVSKKYIIPFESGVCIIKDWKIHNYIAKDRYQETHYKKEKEQLYLDENGSYVVKNPLDNELYTECIQDDNELYTECIQDDDTGKVSIEKIKINKDINMQVFSKNDIEEIYQKYPTRCIISGRSTNKNQKNKDKIKLILKSKKPEELIKDIELFLEDRKKTNTYLPDFSKFLNNIPDPELYNSTPEVANIEEKDPYAGLAPWQIRDKKRDEEYLRELALMQKAEETRIRDQERTIAEMKRRGEWGTDKKTEETDEIWKNWE